MHGAQVRECFAEDPRFQIRHQDITLEGERAVRFNLSANSWQKQMRVHHRTAILVSGRVRGHSAGFVPFNEHEMKSLDRDTIKYPHAPATKGYKSFWQAVVDVPRADSTVSLHVVSAHLQSHFPVGGGGGAASYKPRSCATA